MYKLLIVEDEPIEREAVRLMLGSNCDVLSEIEDAENGFIAIEKCKSFRPDIVMLDINMPGINGLDTIKELQKQDGNIKFLLLSSHDRFEYAQEAIKLGVEDFILKPARIARLKQAIDAIAEKLDSAKQEKQQSTALVSRMESIRPIVESDCIYALLSNGKNEDLERIFSFLEFDVKSGFCFVVSYGSSPRFVLYKLKKTLAEVGVVCIGEQIYNFLVFFVLSDKPMETQRKTEVGNFASMLLREIGNGTGRVGVGGIEESPIQMSLSYKQAMEALSLCAAKDCHFLVYDEAAHEEKTVYADLTKIAGDLLAVIQTGEQESIEQLADEIAASYIFCTKTLEQSRELTYRILVLLIKNIEETYPAIAKDDGFSGISMQAITNIDNTQTLNHYFKMSLSNIAWLIEQQKNGSAATVTNRAISYIENSYDKNISLGDAAKNGHKPVLSE